MGKKDTLVQANPLIEACKPLNTIQTRLFYLALQDVNPHLSQNDKYFDKEFPETTFSPSELKQIFGNNGKYLHLIEKACDNLTSTKVVFRDEDGSFTYIPVFGIAEYKPKVGLKLGFNIYMRQFLLDIFESKYSYTKISMKQVFNLTSVYAMRLLELMLQYHGLMKNKLITRKISLKDIRFFLNVPANSYANTNDFKRYVLDIAKREINQRTAYKLTYDSIRTGRRITDFLFVLDCREVLLEKKNVTLEQLPQKKDRHGLSEKIVNKLTTLCGSNAEFKKRMDYAVSLLEKRQPENVQAFLYKAVAENYLQQEIDRQDEAKKEARQQKILSDFEQSLDGQGKHVFERIIKIGRIAPMTVMTLMKKYGVERCRRNFEAQRLNTNAKNYSGQIIFAIQQDWQGQLDKFEQEHQEQQSQDPNTFYMDGQEYHIIDEPKRTSPEDIKIENPEIRKIWEKHRRKYQNEVE